MTSKSPVLTRKGRWAMEFEDPITRPNIDKVYFCCIKNVRGKPYYLTPLSLLCGSFIFHFSSFSGSFPFTSVKYRSTLNVKRRIQRVDRCAHAEVWARESCQTIWGSTLHAVHGRGGEFGILAMGSFQA